MVIPELGVAPLEDSGTDLEDELPTPDGSSSTDASKPVLGPTPQGVDLERALLELGVLPAMVTPIVDPVVETSATPALYPVPPIPMLSVVDSAPILVASLFRQVRGSPVRDQSLSCQVSPPDSVSEPIPSQISPLLRSEDVARPPSGLAPIYQYLDGPGMLRCRWGSPRISLSCRPPGLLVG